MGKGFYVSRGKIAIAVIVVVALLVVEGLLIGFLVRKSDSSDDVEVEATTSETSKETTAPDLNVWDNLRLPLDLIPLEYTVSLRPILTPDTDGEYWFHGSSSVNFICEEPTKLIIIHSNKLKYDGDIEVALAEDNSVVKSKQPFFVTETMYMVIELEDSCIKGSEYILKTPSFTGKLADDLEGLYRSEYTAKNGDTRVIATTQMATLGARKTFPCFDEPGFKANFSVTLWYKKNTGYFALSNMQEKDKATEEIGGENWEGQVFQETVPMSTYLLAFVVCDFTYAESFSSQGVQDPSIYKYFQQTRIYARSETIENGEAEFAKEITPQILDAFADYFKVPYPLPKSDQMGVPDFAAGAMENWGLVIYRESLILYDEEKSSIFDKRRITSIVAHELAHQWFGNIVTPKWWDDLWLNEGFATYISYYGEEAVRPEWKTPVLFLTDEMQSVLVTDSLTTSRPLVAPVNTENEIQAQFDVISYNKGGSILRMTNDFLGETFVQGLTNYLYDFAYKSATYRDLFKHWEDQAAKDNLNFPTSFPIILETWTLQMGYPVVTIEKNGNDYKLSQEYFLLDRDATPVHTEGSLKYKYNWFIPFTYKESNDIVGGDKTYLWMEPNKTHTITSSTYFLGNIDAKGYFRVNYDSNTWNELSNRLESSHKDFSEENRAQLVDDAFNLARAQRLETTTALSLSQYLKNELAYVPWVIFNRNVEYLSRMLSRTTSFGMFRKYIRDLVEPSVYTSYAWNENNKTDAFQIKRMTTQVAVSTACDVGHEGCISKAKELFSEWMKFPDNASIISSTYRTSVYCTAIANGGVKEWDFAWERFTQSTNAQVQRSLGYGLSCSKIPWVISRYLEYCVDVTKVRKQDGVRFIEYVAAQEYGRDIAWAFVAENWDYIVENYGTGWSFNRLIAALTNRFSTQYDLERLESFVEANDNLGTAARGIDQAIEVTKINIEWRKNNEEKIYEWLMDNVAA